MPYEKQTYAKTNRKHNNSTYMQIHRSKLSIKFYMNQIKSSNKIKEMNE